MNEIVKALLVSLSTSGLLVYLFKRFFDKWVDSFFDKKIELMKLENQKNLLEIQAKLNTAVNSNQQVFNEEFKVFREFSNNVYRCRNRVRSIYEFLSSRNVLQQAINHCDIEQNIQAVSILTSCYRELLFTNRLLLDDDFFEELHVFIRNIEDVIRSMQLYLNEKDSLSDCLDRIEIIYTRIDRAYPAIISNLRNGLGLNNFSYNLEVNMKALE